MQLPPPQPHPLVKFHIPDIGLNREVLVKAYTAALAV
nr:MAG TPA: hypothetical protein [Microviridae sp.]